MSIQSHLAELQRRHAALDTELTREMSRPANDPLRIAELKRKKLVLKDQISRMREKVTVH